MSQHTKVSEGTYLIQTWSGDILVQMWRFLDDCEDKIVVWDYGQVPCKILSVTKIPKLSKRGKERLKNESDS